MSVGRFAGKAFEGLQLPTVTDFMNPKEDYGKTATRGIAERGATDATSMTEIAKIHSAGIGKGAAIESAKHLGEARRYAGQQAGNAAMFGGIASGIGSLGAGAIKGGHFGGKTPPTPPTTPSRFDATGLYNGKPAPFLVP